ncbi:MAG TPA: CPBP family intramembrane glutamic endopeptidase [Thermoanaerobaculia bacterium]|nr:CPBP family intramembrane glutamic endopeptidase [Thermoanaerobaculia bacterium]
MRAKGDWRAASRGCCTGRSGTLPPTRPAFRGPADFDWDLQEIIFRGWLQPLLGLWLTALLFAAAHFSPTDYRWSSPFTWGMVALYFPVSLGIGALFLWRGNLLAPILTHFASDALGLLFLSRALARARHRAATSSPAAA